MLYFNMWKEKNLIVMNMQRIVLFMQIPQKPECANDNKSFCLCVRTEITSHDGIIHEVGYHFVQNVLGYSRVNTAKQNN